MFYVFGQPPPRLLRRPAGHDRRDDINRRAHCGYSEEVRPPKPVHSNKGVSPVAVSAEIAMLSAKTA